MSFFLIPLINFLSSIFWIFVLLCYIFSLTIIGEEKSQKTGVKNYRVIEYVESHVFSVLICFISTSLEKFHSNLCNLTASFSLSLWSPLVGSIENWNLNLIISLSTRIFSISEEKIWDTKFWVYLRSWFLKGPLSLLKQTMWSTLKKKTQNLTSVLNSKSDFTASIFFLSWKESQLLKVMISPRHYSLCSLISC